MKNKFLPLQMLVLASAVVFAIFMWEGNKGFNLWDEGFLWYGVQRVMLGEVPIRDFLSYEPGRYYLSAALMSLWGDKGIMALRGAGAVCQVIGLFAGLLLIARSTKKINFLYLLLSAITLSVWMYPHYKMVDISVSILLIGVLSFLVQSPTSKRYFFTGVCIGLIALFGRNHGLYGVAGSVGVMLWLCINKAEDSKLIKGIALWAAGITIGFAPILFMALLIPGFAVAFWESIRFLFEIKATNVALPIPWPWKVNFSLPIGETIRGVLLGLFFIATVVFGVLAIVYVAWQRWQNKQVSPTLVAASFLALPYAHFAYSRADFYHLAFGIFPLLVGCLVLLAPKPDKIKWPLVLMLCVSSLWVMFSFHPGWQCRASKCVSIEISKSNILVDPGIANDIVLLRKLANNYAQNGQSFIVTPFWPGAYPLLERKSPLWDIYAMFSRPPAFEQAEIERIKTAKPGFVMIFDLPLDGHDELRFKNTRPLVHQYILDNFERLAYPSNSAYQIYKGKWNSVKWTPPPKQNSAFPEELIHSMSDLKILNWGPNLTPQGSVPNLQPDGSAGVWIQVSGEEGLGDVQVIFDGQPAKVTSMSPGLITAAIAASSFNVVGKKEIFIKQVSTGKLILVGVFSVVLK